jgi:nucleoside-diphosphate-sugar epimerase
MSEKTVLVAGGGGFIGGHLVGQLLNEGFKVRSVDISRPVISTMYAMAWSILFASEGA